MYLLWVYLPISGLLQVVYYVYYTFIVPLIFSITPEP